MTVNEEVEPPTITVGINGKTASAELPSGNSEWEEIDLSNIPTDFTNSDVIKVDIHFFGGLYVNDIENWNTLITEDNISENNYGSIILEKGMDDIVPGPDYIYSLYYTNKGLVFTSFRMGYDLNSDTLFYLLISAFNGAGPTSKKVTVTRSNVSTYINKLWRKK